VVSAAACSSECSTDDVFELWLGWVIQYDMSGENHDRPGHLDRPSRSSSRNGGRRSSQPNPGGDGRPTPKRGQIGITGTGTPRRALIFGTALIPAPLMARLMQDEGGLKVAIVLTCDYSDFVFIRATLPPDKLCW